MTAPDFDAAKDRAARELARRLEHVVPASFLADPLAFARQFMTDLQAEHWHHRDTPPPLKLASPDPEATARGVALARAALRKDDHA